jgi:ABC-type dipeptide/oligopeptide/nickel transport system permease subunit
MRFLRRHPKIAFGSFLLIILVLLSASAALIAPYDPIELDVAHRLRPPSAPTPMAGTC